MTAAQLIKRTFAPAALVGQVYVREYGNPNAARMPIGNVLELTLEHEEGVQRQSDMTQLGGGTHAEMRRVTEVNVSMTLADLNVGNWARATLGTSTGVDSGTVTNERHTVTCGALLRTEHVGLSDVVVKKVVPAGTVTDEAFLIVDKGDVLTLAHSNATSIEVRAGATQGAATALTMATNYTVADGALTILSNAPDHTNGWGVWVSYTHAETEGPAIASAGNFEVRPAGLFVLGDAVALADSDVIRVDYSHTDYAVIQALTTKAKELEFTFEGLNEADDGKISVVEIWRASQGVASSITLLQESGFLNLPVSGAVLRDDTKSGTGTSKYYRVTKT